jgi:DNA-binding transcriptional MocR family regulator
MELIYRRIEQEIETLITNGTLQPGQRVPSVREICRTRKVSAASAVQALANLEARALVRARPRSGFFVEARRQVPVPRAAATADSEPSFAGVSDDVARVFRDSALPGVIAFGAGLPDPALLPVEEISRCVARAARTFPRDLGRYDLGRGDVGLRRELARRLSRRGCAVDPDEIVLTNGCMEALNLSLRAVTRPDDIVAVESPTFFGILDLLESLQLRVLSIPASCEEGIDLAALRRGLTRHEVKAVLLVPSFGNPHGASLSQAKREELGDLLARRRTPLIEDDLYSELAFDGNVPVPVKAGPHAAEILHCGSLSKAVSPGLRIGWVAAGRYRERVSRLKIITSICDPATLARAAGDYLRSGSCDRHLRAFRRTLSSQLSRIASTVAATFPQGTAMSRPQGGYFLWVELPEGVEALALRDEAIKHSVSICPGPIFSAEGRFANFIRLNGSLAWRPEIERALTVLGSLAKDLQARSVRPRKRGRSRALSLRPEA